MRLGTIPGCGGGGGWGGGGGRFNNDYEAISVQLQLQLPTGTELGKIEVSVFRNIPKTVLHIAQ